MTAVTYGEYFKDYLIQCAYSRLFIIQTREEEIAEIGERIDPDIYDLLYTNGVLSMPVVDELDPDDLIDTVSDVAYISWLVQDCNYHIMCFHDIIAAIDLF